MVQLSYEERIINALGRVPHPRGQHFMERDKADFAAIRAVLQPLYDEIERLRAQLASWQDLLCHEHDPSGTADVEECISCEKDGLRAQLATALEGGVGRIARERQRQLDVEGFDAEHDEENDFGELSGAGASYADYASRQIATGIDKGHPMNNLWRWSAEWWKPSADPIRNLEKAGALIAAEIDRLQALAALEGTP